LYAAEELQSWAKDLRQKALLLSKNYFTLALGLVGTKSAQPWLYQYMLGKTYYKLEMPVNICLESLFNAIQMLDREGAVYPKNVDFSSKCFAKEAIEVSVMRVIYYKTGISIFVHVGLLPVLLCVTEVYDSW